MLLLLACTSAADSGSEATATWSPTPYDATFVDEAVAPPSIAQIEAGMAAWVPTAAHLPVGAFWDSWWSAADGIDYATPCPSEATRTVTSEGTSIEWRGYDDTCPSGAWYNGYGELAEFQIEGDGFHQESRYTFMTGATVRQADGAEVGGSNTVYMETLTGDQWSSWEQSAYGDFTWSGADAAGSWVEAGWTAWIDTTAFRDTRGADEWTLDAGLSRMDGDFDAINIASAKLALGECTMEPSGTTSLHTPDGVWAVVKWDAWTDDVVDPAKCDGCGDVQVEGVSIGTACYDWSGFVGWEGAPW